jgi:uncharacterized protein (DUF2236 family)
MIRLPHCLQRRLGAAAGAYLHRQGGRTVDFTCPSGEEALFAPDSMSWRIFKNPIALLIGGMAAVILELAEPSVRAAIWDHSSFRKDPMGRLQRTGLAAIVTVYGARSVAEPMIAGVVRMHGKVAGNTPAGIPYSANDARLLTWVHATAGFGFAEAYSRYVSPLCRQEFDALYQEGSRTSRLYGALDAPGTVAEVDALFDAMRGRLEASSIVFQFLQIMREIPALPSPLIWMQPMLVRAAVEMIPSWIRQKLELTSRYGLRAGEGWIVRLVGAVSDRIVLQENPAVQACLRLGLPMSYLYD